MRIEARPWNPQDLIDDLQGMIDEESDSYLNPKHSTLCMARDYLKEYFASVQEEGSAGVERLTYWNKEYECWSYHCPSGDAAKRLAAYEDTGLTPAEVRSMRAEWISARKSAGGLRARLEAEKNEPLTLDELLEMDGEPVYVVDMPRNLRNRDSFWAIVNTERKLALDYIHIRLFNRYGMDWIAYRKKPEAGRV